MAKQTINIGTQANDGTGDTLRTAFTKVNSNFTEVFSTAQAAFNAANTNTGGGSSNDQYARNTANGATGLAQAAFNSANTNASNISINAGINSTQNTNITNATNLAQSAYNYANTITVGVDNFARDNSNTAVGLSQAAFNSANTNASNISIVNAINLTQNTNITNANNLAQSAYNSANNNFSINAGINSTQNTNITVATNLAQSAYNRANTVVVANTLIQNLSGNNYSISNTSSIQSKNFFTNIYDPNMGYAAGHTIQVSSQKITGSLAIGAIDNWLKFSGTTGLFDSKNITIAPDETNGWSMTLGGRTVNQIGVIPPSPTFISESYITDMYGSNINVNKIAPYYSGDLIINGGEFSADANVILGNTNTTLVKVGNQTNVDLVVTGNISSPTLVAINQFAQSAYDAANTGGASTGNIRFVDTWIKNATDGDIFISPQDGYTYLSLPSDAQSDATPVTLGNSNTGNVQIQSSEKQWQFKSDGTMLFPSNTIDTGTHSIDLKSSNYAELWYQATEEQFLTQTNINESAYVWTSSDGTYIQNYRGNDGNSSPTWDKTWQFKNDGSTVFPLSITNLHNGGTQLGQTLQFGHPDHQAIITGPTPAADQNAQRLIIQGQRGQGTGEGGDVYLWAGDAEGQNGGDIKIYAGDADQADAGYGGYINIDAGRGFNNGGSLSLSAGDGFGNPEGGPVGYGGDASLTAGYGTLQNGNVYLNTYGHQWKFGNDGVIHFPVEDSNINKQRFGMGNVAAYLDYGWTICEHNGTTYGTEGIRINPGVEGSADIYLPPEQTANTIAVKVANYNTGGVQIQSGSNTWTFSKDSTLKVPGDIYASNDLALQVSDGIPTGVANWNGQGGWNQGEYTNLATTGGTGTGLTVDVAAAGGGYINIDAITINNPGTGYTNGDVITITNENDLPGTFTITVPTPVWEFKTNGDLQFPDGSIQYTAFGEVVNIGPTQFSFGGFNFGLGISTYDESGNLYNNGALTGQGPDIKLSSANTVVLDAGSTRAVFSLDPGAPQYGTSFRFLSENGYETGSVTALTDATSISCPNSAPFTWYIAPGCIITFPDNSTRTVTTVTPDGGSLIIEFETPITVDPAYPLYVRTPDYAVEDAPTAYLSLNTVGYGFTPNTISFPTYSGTAPKITTDTTNNDISIVNGAGDTWEFKNTGQITLPQGGIISEDETPLGSSNTISLKPNGSNDNQKLMIYATMGGEGNHVHLTSGDLDVTSIFLGNDSQYIRTRADGAVVIGTGDTIPDEASTGKRWIFGADGSLQLPGTFGVASANTVGSGDPAYPTAIDLTKTIAKLADNNGSWYTLADGYEGQIFYLVPQTGTTNANTYVEIANARVLDAAGSTTAAVYTNIIFYPFATLNGDVPNVVTMIFTDGAWQASAGIWD